MFDRSQQVISQVNAFGLFVCRALSLDQIRAAHVLPLRRSLVGDGLPGCKRIAVRKEQHAPMAQHCQPSGIELRLAAARQPDELRQDQARNQAVFSASTIATGAPASALSKCSPKKH